MANKILNTRIQLKYDLYSNWATKNPVLLAGEVALAYIPTDSSLNVGQNVAGTTPPQVLIKVGDGVSNYNDLKYVSAMAADVLAACKSEEGLKAFINDVIADAGIATNEAMESLAGRVGAVETKAQANETAIGVLNGEGDGSVAKKIADAIAALDLGNTYAAKEHKHEIEDVNGLSDAIADAKKAGTDAGDALETYKGTNDQAVAANATAIDNITKDATIKTLKGLEDEIKKYQIAGDYAAEEHTHIASEITDLDDTIKGYDYATKEEAKGYADAKDDAIAAAKAAGDNAQVAVDAITEGATIKTLKGIEEELKKYQATGDYATKEEAQGYAKAVQDELDALEDKVGTIEDGKTVVGLIGEAKQAGVDAQTDVDALAVKVGTVEEGKTVVELIADAKKAGTDAQTSVNTLAERVGTVAADQTVVGLIADAKKAGTDASAALEEYKRANNQAVSANATAIEGLGGRMDTAEGEIDALQEQIKGLSGAMHFAGIKDKLPETEEELAGYATGDVIAVGDKEYVFNGTEFVEFGDISAEGERLTALEQKVGEKAVETQISEAIAAENLSQYAKAADLSETNTKVDALIERVGVEGDVLVFNCGDASTLVGTLTE